MIKKLIIYTFAAAVVCSSGLGQELEPGDKIWSFKTGGWVTSPAIGSDGTLYVGSDDGYFYAIKTANEDTVEAQPAEIAIDTYAGVMIEGTVGAKYRVEFKDKLDDAAKWIAGDVITLPESPYLWVDRFKPVRETRYYRVVLVE